MAPAASVAAIDRLGTYVRNEPTFEKDTFSQLGRWIMNSATSGPAKERARLLAMDLDQKLNRIAEVKVELQRLVDAAQREHAETVATMTALATRVAALEEENRQWQQEYEPDAGDRPSWFSNIRQAVAALSSPSTRPRVKA